LKSAANEQVRDDQLKVKANEAGRSDTGAQFALE
jgi:hypothetical protein